MIGYIQGKVIDTDGKKAVIATVSGIGYEINYGYFLNPGQEVELYIHHHVSENDQSLWGFNTIEDKKMFELLKTVNKVGSSKAYPLITNIGTKELIEAIMFEQTAILTKAPGIGKKMAEQIVLSLKDKVEKFQTTTIETHTPLLTNQIEQKDPSANSEVMQEVMMALESLGYKDKDVAVLVRKQLKDGFNSSQEIIKNILREL